jgi:hypothetical protein
MAELLFTLIGIAIRRILSLDKKGEKTEHELFIDSQIDLYYGAGFVFIVGMLCIIIVAIMKANKWL